MKKSTCLFNALAAGLLFVTSCQKPSECKATVRCVDSTGAPIKNSSVLLYAPVKQGSYTYTADVKASGVTDDDGQVKFTFKLPAIFDIKATRAVNSNTLSGTGLIRLEAGKNAEKEVTLK